MAKRLRKGRTVPAGAPELVAADVAPALVPVYEQGVQAAYLAVPPDVRKLLTATGTSHPYGSGPKKNAIKGPMTS